MTARFFWEGSERTVAYTLNISHIPRVGETVALYIGKTLRGKVTRVEYTMMNLDSPEKDVVNNEKTLVKIWLEEEEG